MNRILISMHHWLVSWSVVLVLLHKQTHPKIQLFLFKEKEISGSKKRVSLYLMLNNYVFSQKEREGGGELLLC